MCYGRNWGWAVDSETVKEHRCNSLWDVVRVPFSKIWVSRNQLYIHVYLVNLVLGDSWMFLLGLFGVDDVRCK